MVKVAVLGAAGGIGQPLSLLLKLNQNIETLHLYDIVNVPGVAADLSHINTNSTVRSFLGQQNLRTALDGIDIVIIPAGVPRKPGMTRDDLFKINAGIVRDLAAGIADACPRAFVLVISNPVNSTVPIVCEVLKQKGVFDPRRVFGVTTLDVVRASRFLRDADPSISAAEISVPVVGGHSGNTIVPLLSQTTPPLPASLLESRLSEITHRIQFGGDEVVQAKDGAGSATLSMAYAASRFATSLIDAIKGGPSTIEPTFIHLDADPQNAQSIRALGAGDLAYFAVPVQLGPNGVESIVPISTVSEAEAEALVVASEALAKNIEAGIKFVHIS
ncbi:hypothetical protein EV182_000234 [Spiromyces aspiralis]|uniref:Uncharacterized protein n=1 Tax=Spiromyces aspiralis TaxID=68401 RepID=A0ACC1HUS6_9FUNG|nr:hypothetical protein EV182_000234 [Spiromyces aspiralis]